jgi:ribosomal protein S18 acetylase RimI-like enzyme
MIREYRPEDLPAIVQAVQMTRTMDEEEIAERMTGGKSFVYEEGDRVLGCAATAGPTDSPEGPSMGIWIYTHPEHRQHGIGSALLNAAWPEVESHNPARVTTGYTAGQGEGAHDFYIARGFAPWFGSQLMEYTGEGFAEPEVSARKYEEQDFEDYVRIMNEGFTDLRRENDLKPAEPFPPERINDELRRKLSDDRDNNYLFFIDGHAVGMCRIEDYIDDIAVDKAHRGQGLGKKIAQFAVNRVRERGTQRVVLGVMDSNQVAQNLYRRLGFKTYEWFEMARIVR